MKNPIEDELYDFLTKEPNFDYLCQLGKQYEVVKRRLITEFWDEVVRNIKLWNRDEAGKDWVLRTTDYFHMYANLSLTKTKWPSQPNSHEVAVSWNGLSGATYFGLWTHANSTFINVREFCLEVQQLPLAKNFLGKDQQWWPLQASSGDDFHLDEHLKRILPDKRQELAESYATTLCDFADNISTDLDRIIGNHKK